MRINTQKVGDKWIAWVDGEPSKRAESTDKGYSVQLLKKRFPIIAAALVRTLDPVDISEPTPSKDQEIEQIKAQIRVLTARLTKLTEPSKQDPPLAEPPSVSPAQ